ncbi:MAG: hypothetical protein H0V47_15770 [Chloroflexia bacterium]|nr:hypothetical protein [Chloroflexia bacterium]
MPKRLRHVNGTKERSRGRECLTFMLKDGRVIVDGIRPKDHLEMVAHLWGAYGKGNVRVTTRRMDRGEQYVDMPEVLEVAS